MGIKNIFNSFLYGDGEESATNNYDEGIGEYDGVDEGAFDDSIVASGSKVSSGVNISSGSSIEMVVVKPEKLESVTQIADYLVDRKTILLNLEETNKETARRLIDFLNGVAYAINGDLRKVATNTYVVTPNNVELSGEKLSTAQEASFDNE